MENICRICASNNNKTISLLQNLDTSSESNILGYYGQKYEDLFGIKVLDIPSYTDVCVTCKKKLDNFNLFKEKAIESQIYLMNKCTNFIEILSNGDDEEKEIIDSQTLSKYDNSIKIEFLDCSNMSTNYDEQEIDESLLGDEEKFETNTIKSESEKFFKEESFDVPHNEDKVIEIKIKEICDKSQLKGSNDDDDDYEDDDDDDINKLRKKPKGKYKSDISVEKKKYKCGECVKTFSIEERYKAHLNVHKGLPAYSCSTCGKGFNKLTNFTYHMKNHKGERSFVCEVCSKAFIIKWDLLIHMRCHRDERPFVCETCGKQFRMLSHLKYHGDTHQEDIKHECNICHKLLRTRNSLSNHMKDKHLTRRFNCEMCDKKYSRKQYFRMHVERYHAHLVDKLFPKEKQKLHRLSRI